MTLELTPLHDSDVSVATIARFGSISGTSKQIVKQGTRLLSPLLFLAVVAATPAVAQSTGTAFCNSQMAETIKNIFTLIQFGGPLIGGVVGLGATVAMSTVRRSDKKRELKELRNQAVIYGIVVASLGATIIQFLLNNVVAGGASCSF